MIKVPHFIRYPKHHAPIGWFLRPPTFLNNRLVNPGANAIDEACRRLGLERVEQHQPAKRKYSIGAAVADPTGERYWLKVSGREHDLPDRPKAAWPPVIAGVPTPSVVKSVEWTAGGIHWLATQMELAPSPVIESDGRATEKAGRVSDQWINSLKVALDCLAAFDTDRRPQVSAEQIRNTIVRRWGENAPYTVDDWRCAHGDMQWSNLTAPDLMLLDWRGPKLAPRGHDIAKLIFCALSQPALVRRLEEAFAEDLESKSGRVAMLLAAASRLNRLEGQRDSKKYRGWIHEKVERVLSGR